MTKDTFYIPRLAIVGVGLIGGSLALALREAGAVGEVIGIGRGLANLEKALELGIVDRITQDAVAGTREADLVFLATPVCKLGEVAAAIIPHLKRGAVITDGGSVKAQVIAAIEPLLRPGVSFVPGHPIAGTEKSGAEAAFATLYHHRRCILTPTQNTESDALEMVERMWRTAGSEVVVMDAEKHDRILAAISHLPHMVAYSLVNAVGSYDRYEENILEYSAGGFRDFTRIASSDPSMWRDIALTNRAALLEMMERFEHFLAELKEDVRSGEGERLYEFFQRSKELRDNIL
ncbi:prephenate dehydrogenase [Geoalkalibacter halelectricus]|uniref:Prephenate dehydrogenase/arogenate dehydrogenase family protein n=1 Tax=Geoalkalibacter halelectricus TaxID=2847045 RepID=A0ABY5ZJP9_9BACT|nr:prephenate dehydrogenase/arogenate dehydrogenase family protein [Geoalkalibacter halelectricus]MDO3379434.1 prephenate dehydrogenase/arogenate dehydrogenase family protein [Geoalkalibacter halelectricus]UWZ78689.1 prephenate dehydrogenase/arogenate dehydrogenase family protein [Geoalkalibacter halelectricus]